MLAVRRVYCVRHISACLLVLRFSPVLRRLAVAPSNRREVNRGTDLMHFDKAFTAKLILQSTFACDDVFETLTRQISDLPANVRGVQALNMSARLIEMAAFELARHLDSEETGALIRCAAELSELASELSDDSVSDVPSELRGLQ